MQKHKDILEKKMFLKRIFFSKRMSLGRNYPWNKPIKQIEQGIIDIQMEISS